MLNIIKYYKFWFVVSTIISIVAIAAVSIFGLQLGIDFKGGTLLQVRFENTPSTDDLRAALTEADVLEAQIQKAGEQSVIIRTKPLENEKRQEILLKLNEKFGNTIEEQYTSIGPIIGKELRSKAFLQLILVSLGIILYIAYAFRKVTKPVGSWRFGVAAIVALVHDLLIVVGAFAFFGHFLGVEIDSLFVTALLTVLGFSVHDTIVVFDRIRENLRIRSGQTLAETINNSINQTLIRSINTSLTVVFVLTALLLFGGETIRWFVAALLIGIIAGTYSSIFIASPILLAWHNWEVKRRSA